MTILCYIKRKSINRLKVLKAFFALEFRCTVEREQKMRNRKKKTTIKLRNLNRNKIDIKSVLDIQFCFNALLLQTTIIVIIIFLCQEAIKSGKKSITEINVV